MKSICLALVASHRLNYDETWAGIVSDLNVGDFTKDYSGDTPEGYIEKPKPKPDPKILAQ